MARLSQQFPSAPEPITPVPPTTRQVARRRREVLPLPVRELDQRVGAWVNQRHTHPNVDRAYGLVSRAANRGALWFGLAGVLLATGRRRAAVRGVLSLAGASILANLVGKQIFGGNRPLLDDIPVGRQLRTAPTSGSFPSGHSASAAAFAVGVALESPKTGAAIAPLAGAVAYSRMHVGAHWFSDVIGGLALGTGVALLGRALVGGPKQVTSVMSVPEEAAAELPALPDGTGALIFANPNSGRDKAGPDPLELMGTELPGARIHRLRKRDRIDRLVAEALSSDTPPLVLGVSGGDGTVGAVAHEARLAGIPLLVIPGGTYNHFAGSAGVSSTEAAIRALQEGTGQRIDVAELVVGTADPVTVLNTASVGLYPEFVAEREKREKKLGKKLAALISSATVIRKAKPLDVTLHGDAGESTTGPVWSVFIGVNRYYPETAAPLQRKRLDDGVLDVRILHARDDTEHGGRTRGAIGLAFRKVATARLGRLGFWRSAPTVESMLVDELSMRVVPRDRGDAGFAHDGEASMTTPGRRRKGGAEWRMRILPGALTVYAPAPPPPRLGRRPARSSQSGQSGR